MEEFWNIARQRDRVRYLQASSYGPYSEFSANWKDQKGDTTLLSFNSFYRYDEIMQPLFNERFQDPEVRDWLFDIYVHLLVELEYLNGATTGEFATHRFIRKIKNAEYGERLAGIFEKMTDNEQYFVADLLVKQSRTGESVDKYGKALVELMPNGILYKDKFHTKQLLLYVNQKENRTDLDKIYLVNELFCPLGTSLRVFWDKHFAVLGEEQTMELGEIELI